MIDFSRTPMTKEIAEKVRLLRVVYGFSWRALAGKIAEEWPELNIDTHDTMGWPTCGYQSEGIALCEAAAKFFGEISSQKPWN